MVGVHGAAISNILFMRVPRYAHAPAHPHAQAVVLPPPALLELTQPSGYSFPTGFRDYAHLASALGVAYWALPLEQVGYAAGVRVDVPAVTSAVDAALLAL